MTLFSILFVSKNYMIFIKFKISNLRKFHQSFGRISGKICQSGAQRDRINVTRPETMQIRQKSRSLTEISGSCHCLWILNCDFYQMGMAHMGFGAFLRGFLLCQFRIHIPRWRLMNFDVFIIHCLLEFWSEMQRASEFFKNSSQSFSWYSSLRKPADKILCWIEIL